MWQSRGMANGQNTDFKRSDDVRCISLLLANTDFKRTVKIKYHITAGQTQISQTDCKTKYHCCNNVTVETVGVTGGGQSSS